MVSETAIEYNSTAEDSGNAIHSAVHAAAESNKVLLLQCAVAVLGASAPVKLGSACRARLYQTVVGMADKGKESSKSLQTRRLIREKTTLESVESRFATMPKLLVEGVRCLQYHRCDFCKFVVAVAYDIGDVDVSLVYEAFGSRWGHHDSHEGRLINRRVCCSDGTHAGEMGTGTWFKPVFNFKEVRAREDQALMREAVIARNRVPPPPEPAFEYHAHTPDTSPIPRVKKAAATVSKDKGRKQTSPEPVAFVAAADVSVPSPEPLPAAPEPETMQADRIILKAKTVVGGMDVDVLNAIPRPPPPVDPFNSFVSTPRRW